MPNGDDASWVRICAAIDGFRARYGRWPVRARLFPEALSGLRDHVLTPQGLALVATVVDLVADDTAPMIAEGAKDESYNYGQEGFPARLDEPAREWFGQAILIPDLREW